MTTAPTPNATPADQTPATNVGGIDTTGQPEYDASLNELLNSLDEQDDVVLNSEGALPLGPNQTPHDTNDDGTEWLDPGDEQAPAADASGLPDLNSPEVEALRTQLREAEQRELQMLREAAARQKQTPDAGDPPKAEPTVPDEAINAYAKAFERFGPEAVTQAAEGMKQIVSAMDKKYGGTPEAPAQPKAGGVTEEQYAAAKQEIGYAFPAAATDEGWAKVEAASSKLAEAIRAGKVAKPPSLNAFLSMAARAAFSNRAKTSGQVRPVSPNKGTPRKATERDKDLAAFAVLERGGTAAEARRAYESTV